MDEEYKKLLNLSYKYLGIRARSEKEIRDYLKIKMRNLKLDDSEILINQITQKLKDQRFLNDEEFARMWVESRNKLKPRANRIIKIELKQKGVSDEIIETVLSTDVKVSDKDSALILAQKRVERLKKEDIQKQKEKLFRFLASKGYNYDTIKEVVDQILGR